MATRQILWADHQEPVTGRFALDRRHDGLNRFLASVERRAFRMAAFATRNDEDALDIVQDAMFKLTRNYGDRDESEWPPLFQTILQHLIRDWDRRRRVRSRWQAWLPFSRDEEDAEDALARIADERIADAATLLMNARAMEHLDEALRLLPLRQQQAFLLRVWEGLDVGQTARAMGVSEGSVKTHFFRATLFVRKYLGERGYDAR